MLNNFQSIMSVVAAVSMLPCLSNEIDSLRPRTCAPVLLWVLQVATRTCARASDRTLYRSGIGFLDHGGREDCW